ncbi:hypothetical protein KFL_015650010 [Klebsormidium nitens]|uniref:Uncharacterized protein n=1 Tax=Klebsormidium nitens TaxID=105231 RepID=A0A1Y1IYR7_KLENI|nr:hypothetical protein KFL_015650010 [Klebsormidium nitens]|eukprot:GAQ93478.1 hypothetical protein KFL_015650010 [Klebsormidium nitens]
MASANPSSYAKVTISTSGPPASNPPTEADSELDEFFAANPGRLYGAYVTYPSSFSKLQDNIIVGIRDTITKHKSKFSDEGSYSAEFKGGTASRRDLHRILVAFTEEADQQAFKDIRHVVFEDDKGGLLHAQIGQDRISYEEILGNKGAKGAEKVFIVLKKMPDSWTQNQIVAAFTTFTWKARGFTHPFVSQFSKITWFWHKSGVQRRMLIAEVIPHEEDPNCEKVPSVHNPKPGKTARSSLGAVFTSASCVVRKAIGQKCMTVSRADLHSRGRAKTELMDEIEKDKYVKYVASDVSREAWKCTLCKKAGNGFYRCYRHVKGSDHMDALADLVAEKTETDEPVEKEDAAGDAA